ncbi:hypothetical protein QWY16_10815 [Planococcus shenhongbingii]|uniref:hypothetical protein n=1 Tax=Planococcus shenhongbingii TaxID=3058398 RepID=UPI002604F8A3|nr:hypothetical protein [Planococcus sp. N016]WKA57004.1 hypothetical protein QWY16_10815 [Planococcus sp. N016]
MREQSARAAANSHIGDANTGEVDELAQIELLADTTLVLFLVGLEAPMTFAGNFSGIKR